MSGKRRILLVEDDDVCSTMASKVLEERGYEVDVSPDVMKAMFKTANFDYDLVVIDYELPVFKGSDMEPLLRERGLPAMYFTGHTQAEIKTRLPVVDKSGGATALLSKVDEILHFNAPVAATA